MRRIGTVLVVVLTVIAGVALPAVGMQTTAPTAAAGGETTWGQTETAVDSETETAESGNETADPAPGTRLAGSVGVQGAELGGELETRSLDHQLNRSKSNASKAQVIARQTNQSQARLMALRTELQQLEQARANGSVGPNEYRVRAAGTSARVSALQHVANRTSASANTLPVETLRQNGVNVTALERLRTEADQLTGPEVAAIARSVAGPSATRATGLDRAANESARGPGSDSSTSPDSPGRSGGARGGGQSDNNAADGGTQSTASDGNVTASENRSQGNETTSGGESGTGPSGGGGGPDEGRNGGNHGGNSDSGSAQSSNRTAPDGDDR